jgi:acyl carrier protein
VSDVPEQVLDIATRILELEPGSLDPAWLWADDLGATSLVMMEILVELERRFDVQLDAQEMAGVASVGDLVDLVERRRAGHS